MLLENELVSFQTTFELALDNNNIYVAINGYGRTILTYQYINISNKFVQTFNVYKIYNTHWSYTDQKRVQTKSDINYIPFYF